MWQLDFASEIAAVLATDERTQALFLAGSLGKGRGDRFSDVDLVAVIDPENWESYGTDWTVRLEAMSPIVFWNVIRKPEYLANAITDSWQRIDLLLQEPATMVRRARGSLVALHDPQQLQARLPEAVAWPGHNAGRIEWGVNEFIRILGLLTVAMGREEFSLARTGFEMQRTILVGLLNEEIELADKGGMLNWKTLYSAEQLAVIDSIPAPEPNEDAFIAANLVLAGVYLPRARRMIAQLGRDWPERFEEATWALLGREFGMARPY